MKKSYILILLASFFCLVPRGNAQSFDKGQKDLNLGIGLGSTFYGTGFNTVIPPLSASFDYGITDAISLGGYLGFAGAKWSFSGNEWCNMGNGNGNGFGNYYSYTDTYKWNFFILGVRGAYHFAKLIKVDKLDVYAGLMLGDDIATSSFSTTSVCPDHVKSVISISGGFVWSIFGGARYRFNEHAGVFGELGYGIAVLNIGFNYRF